MLRRNAAAWLARLQNGPDPDVERRFRAWRDADPRHAEAFDRVRASYEKAGLLRHSSLLVSSGELRGHAPARQPVAALAAAVALALLVGIALIAARTMGRSGTEAVMLATPVGEIRQVVLRDGSRVTLDTATRVGVEIGKSDRSARIDYGRARFAVAPGERPFRVLTGNRAVSIRDGVIDVEHAAGRWGVRVIAGDARIVRAGGSPAAMALRPGEAATVTATGAERSNARAESGDWTRGMLQFDSTPLATAIAIANRYSRRQIILVGDAGALRVTGAIRAGDTPGLAKALAAAFGLSLRQGANGNLILVRPAAGGPAKKNGG